MIAKAREMHRLYKRGFGAVARDLRALMNVKLFDRCQSPRQIAIDVTSACNGRCLYCFRRRGEGKDIDVDLVRQVLSEVAVWKPGLLLTGGEPLLHKRFEELCDVVGASGLGWGMVTNGERLTDTITSVLERTGMSYAIVSVDGLEETSARFRPGYDHKRVLANIERLAEGGKRCQVIVNCVVGPFNVAELQDLVKRLKAVGVRRLRFQLMSYLTEAEYQLNQERRRHWDFVKEPDCFLVDRAQPWSEDCREAFALALAEARRCGMDVSVRPHIQGCEITQWFEGGRSRLGCLYTRMYMRIACDGTVYACHGFREPLGTIGTDKVSDIWKSSRYNLIRAASKEHYPVCHRCSKM